MGKEIEINEHLVYLNPNVREREAIERIMVGVYSRNSGAIAQAFGIDYYAHTLLVDIPWHAFVSEPSKLQGDIDFAILPTMLKNDRYDDGITELTYNYEDLLVLEVKTSVMQGGEIRSRKATQPHLRKTLAQISKYYATGFTNAAIFQIVLGEPTCFTYEDGTKVNGIMAWNAAVDLALKGGKAEVNSAADTEGSLDVQHVVMAYGAIPGFMEGTSGSFSFPGVMKHRIKSPKLATDVKSQLIEKLKQVLPSKWGNQGFQSLPSMPIVRACRKCHSLLLSQSPVSKCQSCSTCDSLRTEL